MHNDIFHLIQLCYNSSILLSITSPVLFTKLKEDFFAYIAASAYHVISKEVKNHVFRHNWFFRHTCMYKQPTLTKFSDTVGGYFLNMLSTPRKNKVLVRNVRRRICERDITFWLHVLLSMIFFVPSFFCSLPIPKWRTC